MIKYLLLFTTLAALTSCSTTQIATNTSTIKPRSYNQNKLSVLPSKELLILQKKQSTSLTSDLVDDLKVSVIEEDDKKRYQYELAKQIIQKAESFLGTPYRYGGTSRRGIDCSSFVQKAFAETPISLPRVSKAQAHLGERIDKSTIQTGDLVFFATAGRGRVSHVGIVHHVEADGDINFIHASSSQGVTITPLSNSYWSKRYLFAKRIINNINPFDFKTQQENLAQQTNASSQQDSLRML